MELLGAEVRPVSSGSRTLKDAVNEALRDWVASVGDTHYCLGSVMGPHPYPWMVREFQRIIGDEAREQCRELLDGVDPDVVVACAGGGSNAAGIFAGFADATGGRPGGGGGGRRGGHDQRHPRRPARHAQRPACRTRRARSSRPTPSRPGWTTRASAPSTPTSAELGRARYESADDAEVLEAFQLLARTEGIIPALESAHAMAWVIARAGTEDLPSGSTVLVNLSGRGDKDVAQVRDTAAPMRVRSP